MTQHDMNMVDIGAASELALMVAAWWLLGIKDRRRSRAAAAESLAKAEAALARARDEVDAQGAGQ